MAFVVIQHLDPTGGIWNYYAVHHYGSTQVTDRLKVLPDHIYVIPPNKSLTILNGVLHLFALFKVGGCDYRYIFFRSLDKLNKVLGLFSQEWGLDEFRN
jgi:two-component system CheB/CheR fusion protein